MRLRKVDTCNKIICKHSCVMIGYRIPSFTLHLAHIIFYYLKQIMATNTRDINLQLMTMEVWNCQVWSIKAHLASRPVTEVPLV